MPKIAPHLEHAALARSLLKWSLLGAWVGLLGGVASFVFLKSLDWAISERAKFPWLLYFLPLAGVAIGFAYSRHANEAAGGNNLILDRIHDPKGTIPFRMIPLVLVGTVVTHLFGGSAGREGTAVQMGATLADLVTKPLRLSGFDRRILLMTGISAGFGSVFGTPLAGAVFGMEVLTIGAIGYEALVPCLVGGMVGDFVCRGLGVNHTAYHAAPKFEATPMIYFWIVCAGILFAAAGGGFAELTHRLSKIGKNLPQAALLRPFLGGVVVIALTLIVGNQDYNGLGIPLISRSFDGLNVPLYAFALKLLFTSITLAAGFKGGEVTPLFCIGATLGNAFAQVTHQDPALFAALGFVAVFAGAANTPLACTIMGIELFGGHLAVPLAVSCVIAYILSGHRGIYLSQRVRGAKTPQASIKVDTTLRSIDDEGFELLAPRRLKEWLNFKASGSE
jgi:H+/Cl- antiporter ClcA